MALLQPTLDLMARTFDDPDPVYPTYRDLIARVSDTNPKTGNWWRTTPETFQQLTLDSIATAEAFGNAPPSFVTAAPHPRPELRITPRINSPPTRILAAPPHTSAQWQ